MSSELLNVPFTLPIDVLEFLQHVIVLTIDLFVLEMVLELSGPHNISPMTILHFLTRHVKLILGSLDSRYRLRFIFHSDLLFVFNFKQSLPVSSQVTLSLNSLNKSLSVNFLSFLLYSRFANGWYIQILILYAVLRNGIVLILLFILTWFSCALFGGCLMFCIILNIYCRCSWALLRLLELLTLGVFFNTSLRLFFLIYNRVILCDITIDLCT